MKLFLASDIHGSLPATEQILIQFEKSQADWLILLGDFLYHGPRNPLPEGYNPAAVAELLNQQMSKIIAVRGNCDSEVDQMLLKFPLMVTWQQIPLADRRIFLTHGHHYQPDNLPTILQPGDLFISGHTHIPMAKKVEQIYCINPGSVSIPKGGYEPSFGLLTAGKVQILSLKSLDPIIEIIYEEELTL